MNGHYAHDLDKAMRIYEVDEGGLDVLEVERLVGLIEPTMTGFRVDTRMELLPASMPGTTMMWPTGTKGALEPNANLFGLCLLNDIRTLGLPIYHATRSSYRKLGGPVHLLTSLSPYVKLEKSILMEPHSYYREPECRASVMALTGAVEGVGPLFREMASFEAKESDALPFGNLGLPQSSSERETSRPDSVETSWLM